MKNILFVVVLLFLSGHAAAQRSDFWDINFYKADSVAALYEGHDLKKPDELVEKLIEPFHTDVEKFRAIFRWITDNIDYDFDLYQRNQTKQQKLRYNKKSLRKWDQRFSKKVYAHTIRKKTSICSGYARLLEYMANKAGINCETITGIGRNQLTDIGKTAVNHAWNAVQLNGDWYLCDATWAAGSLDLATRSFTGRFNKNYFLTDPSLFIADHYPSDTSWILLYRKPSVKEFANAPLVYHGFFSSRINQYSPKQGVQKIKQCAPLVFDFTANTELSDKEVDIFIKGNKINERTTYALKKKPDGRYVFEHVFEAKGNYVVDIYINSKATFGYRVLVN